MKRNKKEQFIKLAESRINKAATMLWCVGNLSNKMLYEYDEQDVERIFSYLQEKLNEAKQRFENAKQGRKKFSLSDEIKDEIPPTEYPNLLLDYYYVSIHNISSFLPHVEIGGNTKIPYNAKLFNHKM